MEKLLIIAEKPSAGRNFSAALGGSSGTFENDQYVIVNLRGHILAHEAPEKVAYPNHADTVGGFGNIDNLPWSHTYFDFDKKVIPNHVKDFAAPVIRNIKDYLNQGYIPVVASDVDAMGEGDLLVHEVLNYVGYKGKIYREYHVDETPKSIQNALRDKKDVTSQNDGYVAGTTRMVLDFLTQQMVRVATVSVQDQGYKLPRPVPVGRLQSTMMNMVGSQIDAINAYVPSSKFESRYNLDDILILKNAEVEQFATRDAWSPGDFPPEATVREVKQVPGRTVPPKALTLTGLGGLLSRQGLSAKTTMALVQKMYDDAILSYPRTEDNFITPEQFDEISPQVDTILGLLELSPAVFTHRTPRPTHVKTGGSHGALRPGSKLPDSIAGLDAKYGAGAAKVYKLVAERFVMMFLEDTEWVRHEYETIDTPIPFTGSIRIITKNGVTDPDENNKDVVSSLPNINNKAKLYAHEVKTVKPSAPTEAWLLAELIKHNVGTSSTQMTTTARLIGNNGNFPFLSGKKSSDALSLSPIGTVGYDVARHISLGSPDSTRHFEDVIKQVIKGEKTPVAVYDEFTETLRQDIDVIKSLSFDFKALGFASNTKRIDGVWKGQKVSVPNGTAGYTFTDGEMDQLFAGHSVSFTGLNFHKQPIQMAVKLGPVEYKGQHYVGFHDAAYHYGQFDGQEIRFKRSFMDYTFSDDECEALLRGENLSIVTTNKDGNKQTLSGQLEKQSIDGGPVFYGYKAVFPMREGYVKGIFDGKEITMKGSWSDHVFTQDELARLFDGKSIVISYTSKNGDTQQVDGKIEKQIYKGRPFFGFKANFPTKRDS